MGCCGGGESQGRQKSVDAGAPAQGHDGGHGGNKGGANWTVIAVGVVLVAAVVGLLLR